MGALERAYPEVHAGGFARHDQIILFFLRVRLLIKPSSVVVDFGAGRGRIADGEASPARDFRILNGLGARLIGVDIDPLVLENPIVDEAYVIGADGRIPLPDESVDLIYSCATLEHIETPRDVAAEAARVLRPGGWFCAWTPNKWGYVGIGARLVPNALHARFVKGLEPNGRESHDVFATFYRMNTISDVRAAFGRQFEDFSYYLAGTPSYHADSDLLLHIWNIYNSIAPDPLKKSLHVFLRKRA